MRRRLRPPRACAETIPCYARSPPQFEAIRKEDNGDVVLSLYGVDIVTVRAVRSVRPPPSGAGWGLYRPWSALTLGLARPPFHNPQVRANGDVVLDAGKFRGLKTFMSMNDGEQTTAVTFSSRHRSTLSWPEHQRADGSLPMLQTGSCSSCLPRPLQR